VFFMTDDHSPIPVAEERTMEHRAFGFNGETHVYTPVIDRLARDGMIFTRAYVSSSVCSPSRYTMLTGRYENTLIVMTSDHGIYRQGKTTLYEHGVRVPLAVHWPAGIEPGSTCEQLVQNIDYAPTFLDLAGARVPAELQADGVSLRSLFEGRDEPLRDYLYFEMGFARAVTTKDWKYIVVRYDEGSKKQIAAGEEFVGWQGRNTKLPYYTRNSHLGYHASLHHPHYFAPEQLFHLGVDPHEHDNVVGDHPDKAAELRAYLTSSLQSFPGRPFEELTEERAP
jgi:arylsulfatase A-like enzyme